MFDEKIQFTTVAELNSRSKNVNVEVKIVSIEEARKVRSRSDSTLHRVTEALVGDSTGVVLLTLWDEQIDAFSVGKTYAVKNAFINLINGTMHLNVGR
ncbi:Single-stranded DNA binding protein Ssb [uncultured archaeon]|nr:Single-stranded DNA binding protein Ssb [uncultured archaeon]